MFKKKEEINDLNDISLVNPEEEKQTTFALIYNIVSESLSYMITFLLLSFTDITAIAFLGKVNLKNDIIELQFSLSLTYLITLLFSIGFMKILVSSGKTKKLYFEVITLVIIFILLVFIPIILVSYFFAPFGCWWDFLIYSPLFILFKILLFCNFKVLEIKKQMALVNMFSLIFFIFYALLGYILIIANDFGIRAIAILNIIIYAFAYLTSLVSLAYTLKMIIRANPK